MAPSTLAAVDIIGEDVEDPLLATGARGALPSEFVRAFSGDGTKLGVEHLPDPCLAMNGDVITTIDIAGHMMRRRESSPC